jgi:F0F1-type ATP synthase epsilon subunit
MAKWQRPTLKEIAEAAIDYIQKHEAAVMADHAIEIDDENPLSLLRERFRDAEEQSEASWQRLKRLVRQRTA